MKRGCEAALTGNEVRPTFENLRRQTSGHASRLPGKGTSHIKSAGRVAAGDDFDCPDRLRPRRLCCVERILRTGSARLNLRHVKVAREPLRFLQVCELRI